MSLSTHVRISALALPFLFLPSGETLEFAPHEDTLLSLTFEQESSSELVKNVGTMFINGEENDDFEVPAMEIERTFLERIEISDEFLAIEGQNPTHVRRVFEDAGSRFTEKVTVGDGEEHETEDVKRSELQSRTLEFRWDDEDGEYKTSFTDEDEDAAEELLTKLELTGYLAELLPGTELSEGDEWQVDASVFRTLIYPGGDLSYIDVEADGDEIDDERRASEEDWSEQYENNLEGEISLEFQGLRDEDGSELMVIAVHVDVETRVEQEQKISVVVNEEEGEGTRAQTFSFSIDVSGELLWDMELGHALSLKLAGENGLEQIDEQDMQAGGVQIVLTATKVFEGTVKYSYSFE